MIIDERSGVLAEARAGTEELIVAELDYQRVIQARAELPTVRDSNLDLIHRETSRVRNQIGYPGIVQGKP